MKYEDLVKDMEAISEKSVSSKLDEIRTEFKAEMDKIRIEVGEDLSKQDKKGGFKSFDEFAMDCVRAELSGGRELSTKLAAWTKTGYDAGANIGNSADGGYLVPTAFRNQLWMDAIEKANFPGLCTSFPIQNTNKLDIPVLPDPDHTASLYGASGTGGNALINIVNEGVNIGARKVQFNKVTFTLKKYAGLAYATDEMLRFSPITVESVLSQVFTDGLAWKLDSEILNASGGPIGVLNATALYTITPASSGTNIVYADALAMYAGLKRGGSLASTRWVLGHDVFAKIAGMYVATGSYSGQPVYLPATGAAGAPYGTLFGIPIVISEHCQASGTKGDIYLIDFSKMGVGYAGAPQWDVDMSFKFDQAVQTFRLLYYFDAEPLTTAKTKLASGAYVSPFVALNTRAS